MNTNTYIQHAHLSNYIHTYIVINIYIASYVHISECVVVISRFNKLLLGKRTVFTTQEILVWELCFLLNCIHKITYCGEINFILFFTSRPPRFRTGGVPNKKNKT